MNTVLTTACNVWTWRHRPVLLAVKRSCTHNVLIRLPVDIQDCGPSDYNLPTPKASVIGRDEPAHHYTCKAATHEPAHHYTCEAAKPGR